MLLLSLSVCAFADDLVLITGDDGQEDVQPFVSPNTEVSGSPVTVTDGNRVVDLADIFSDAQENLMRSKISEISMRTKKDIVIYTDNSSYGREHRILAADFYDYNGYGIGPGHDGIILFICMEPSYRGWQAVTTGSVMDIYTEKDANRLDDMLYEYLASGRYGEGVLEWIGHIDNLYTKGRAFTTDWGRVAGTGTIIGVLVGLVSLLIARSKMKVVSAATRAGSNLDEDSFKVSSRDHLDHISTTRRYIPPPDNNRSGGGGSSFGGGFKGSSGTSHTSSGGRF